MLVALNYHLLPQAKNTHLLPPGYRNTHRLPDGHQLPKQNAWTPHTHCDN